MQRERESGGMRFERGRSDSNWGCCCSFVGSLRLLGHQRMPWLSYLNVQYFLTANWIASKVDKASYQNTFVCGVSQV